MTEDSSTVDLLVRAGTALTMADGAAPLDDAVIAVDKGRIVAVGTTAELDGFTARRTIGGPDDVVIPGLINAHQHLTGDRLVRSMIPDDIDSDTAIFQWAVPVHAAHQPDDDEVSATLSLLEAVGNGITHTVEAGTVAHPARVLAAFDAVGVSGTLGSWGSDTDGLPYAGTVDEVLDRQRATLAMTADRPLVDGWVTLVGHDLMSDELISAASALAREHGTGLTFHLSPSGSDAVAYRERTGRRPAVHLDELGALGSHVLIGHGVHLDDAELDVLLERDVAIAYCPWAYLRLAQGVTRAGRHAEFIGRGGRVALGCDAENAGDAIDILRVAALAAGLAKDMAIDPTALGARAALHHATLGAARAIGADDEIGSIEVGKRADLAIVDTSGPEWHPRSTDPYLQLVWASDGRSVRDVIVNGEVVLEDRRPTRVDVEAVRAAARERQRRLLAELPS